MPVAILTRSSGGSGGSSSDAFVRRRRGDRDTVLTSVSSELETAWTSCGGLCIAGAALASGEIASDSNGVGPTSVAATAGCLRGQQPSAS